MKVLVAIFYPVYGGPQNEVVRLVRPFSSRGVELVAVVPSDGTESANRMKRAGVSVVEVPMARLRATRSPAVQLGTARAFRRTVQRFSSVIAGLNVDVVMTTGLLNPHAALAARVCDVPLIWKLLDSGSPPLVRRLLSPLVRAAADVVLFNGDATRAAHDPDRRWSVPSLIYVPPVPTDVFHSTDMRRQEARCRLRLPLEAPVVGTVANVNPMKGIDLFLRAAAKIAELRPDARFLVAGSRHETHGRYWDEVQHIAALPPLQGRVIFTGLVDDPSLIYPALDVKVIASRTEGTTTTALEAMASEVPVVAHRVGAVSEVVTDPETGTLTPPGDTAALAAAIERYLSDPGLARQVGRSGRRRVETFFSLEQCTEVHLKALRLARGRQALFDPQLKVVP